jgi:hypothetical protein
MYFINPGLLAKCRCCDECIIRQDLFTNELGVTPNVCLSCYIAATRKLENEGKLRIIKEIEGSWLTK